MSWRVAMRLIATRWMWTTRNCWSRSTSKSIMKRSFSSTFFKCLDDMSRNDEKWNYVIYHANLFSCKETSKKNLICIVFERQTTLIKSRFSNSFSMMIWIKCINENFDKYFERWFTSYWKREMIDNLSTLCELTTIIISLFAIFKTKRSMHFKFLYRWCQTISTRSKSFKNALNVSTIFETTNAYDLNLRDEKIEKIVWTIMNKIAISMRIEICKKSMFVSSIDWYTKQNLSSTTTSKTSKRTSATKRRKKKTENTSTTTSKASKRTNETKKSKRKNAKDTLK